LNLYKNRDKNTREEKHIFTTGIEHTTICSNNNKYRFTILEFTLTMRDPVISIYITKGKNLIYEQIIEINITIPYINYTNSAKELTTNTSLGKRFLEGLICIF